MAKKSMNQAASAYANSVRYPGNNTKMKLRMAFRAGATWNHSPTIDRTALLAAMKNIISSDQIDDFDLAIKRYEELVDAKTF